MQNSNLDIKNKFFTASINNLNKYKTSITKENMIFIKPNFKLLKVNEKLNYKIREISNAKIPFLIVVGEKEVQEKTLSIRELGTKQTSTLKIEEFLKKLKKSCRIS